MLEAGPIQKNWPIPSKQEGLVMAEFHFKLDMVLQQRRMVEDQRQRELAKALRQRMILLDQLRQMQVTITDSKRDLREGLVGVVDMTAVAQFARYSGQTTARAQAIVTKLASVEKQAEMNRLQLIEATQARKAIERLREKQYRKWKTEQDRREAAMLDEIGVGQFAFRLMTSRP